MGWKEKNTKKMNKKEAYTSGTRSCTRDKSGTRALTGWMVIYLKPVCTQGRQSSNEAGVPGGLVGYPRAY